MSSHLRKNPADAKKSPRPAPNSHGTWVGGALFRSRGGHPETPCPASPYRPFQSNLRLKPLSPLPCQTGVLYETSPPCGDPPLHPFLFSEGGGVHFVRPLGGFHVRPLCCNRPDSASRGVSDAEVVSGIFKKRGGGSQIRLPPRLWHNETPHPWHTPPCPGFFLRRVGGLHMYGVK